MDPTTAPAEERRSRRRRGIGSEGTAAAILGLLLVQIAYEAGPLAASMPVVDSVDPAVATVSGITLFREHVRTGPWPAGIGAGIATLLAGIARLDTSPLIHRLQRVERRQRLASERPAAGTATPEPEPELV